MIVNMREMTPKLEKVLSVRGGVDQARMDAWHTSDGRRVAVRSVDEVRAERECQTALERWDRRASHKARAIGHTAHIPYLYPSSALPKTRD